MDEQFRYDNDNQLLDPDALLNAQIPTTHSELKLQDNLPENFTGNAFNELSSLGVELYNAGDIEQELYRRADESIATYEVYGDKRLVQLSNQRKSLERELQRLEKLVKLHETDPTNSQLEEADLADLKQAIVKKKQQINQIAKDEKRIIESNKRKQEQRKAAATNGSVQLLDDMIREQAKEMAELASMSSNTAAQSESSGPVAPEPPQLKPTPANRPRRKVVMQKESLSTPPSKRKKVAESVEIKKEPGISDSSQDYNSDEDVDYEVKIEEEEAEENDAIEGYDLDDDGEGVQLALDRDDFDDEAWIERLSQSDLSDDQEYANVAADLKVNKRLYDKLFQHQRVCLRWLWELHKQECGGIVGDEMGLGKTAEVISFFQCLLDSDILLAKFDEGDSTSPRQAKRKVRARPILVVSPATVMRQWVREFHMWAPRFRVFLYHTSNAKIHARHANRRRRNSDPTAAEVDKLMRQILTKSVSDPHTPTVVITTYEMVRLHAEMLVTGPTTPNWIYVVLDEGHKLRNPQAAITTVCKQFATSHRLLLTGAPIQNNLIELWSLFDFVFPGKLGTLETFTSSFAQPIIRGGFVNASQLEARMAYKCAVALRDLIKPYLLRRLKKDVNIELPKKNEQVLFCQLTPIQRQLYLQFLNSKEARLVYAGKKNLLFGIDILRKICNHTLLLKDETANMMADLLAGKPGSEQFAMTMDELMEKSVKLRVLKHVLASWRADRTQKVLIFSQTRQMLDIIEYFIRLLEYTYVRLDGNTPVAKRATLIDFFNHSSADEAFIFLLTTRVGGLGISLTSASKVLIFDPDWNPVTDSQARERSYRIGQTRDVTIYRLITSGTVEEKIYQRQIFKQFITNRVLTDPRLSRALFRARDLKDLFRLEDQSPTSSTETHRLVQEANELEEGEKPTKAAPKTEQNEADEQLLEGLVGSALHARINHDIVVGDEKDADNSDINHLYEREAERLAKSAVERLKRSRDLISPPPSPAKWAGAGMFGKTRKFNLGQGNAPDAPAAPAEIPVKRAGFSILGDAPKAPLSSTALLQAARQHADPTQRVSVSEQDMLANDLLDFLQSNGNRATSEQIIERFQDRIRQDKSYLVLIKSLLKQLAKFNKASQVWVLNSD